MPGVLRGKLNSRARTMQLARCSSTSFERTYIIKKNFVLNIIILNEKKTNLE
jgi:hypothetical protein